LGNHGIAIVRGRSLEDRAVETASLQQDPAVETASLQTLTRRERVEEMAVKITLFSLHRGGGRKFL
jgi:hypothetical protein